MEQQLIRSRALGAKLSSRRGKQDGFSLPIAIVFALVLLLIATSVAKKSINATNAVLGVTMRQAASNGGDRATLMAAAWLNNNSISLTASDPGNGFYAIEQKNIDWTGLATPGVSTDDVNWDGTNTGAALNPFTVPAITGDTSGNTYQYVIQRLCDIPGAYTTTSGVSCMIYTNTSIPTDYRQGMLYNVSSITTSTMIYYRVTVRTYNAGTGSVSYTQSLILVNT